MKGFGALMALFCATTPCHCAVKVTRVDFQGWRNSWRVSNGTVELVFVPQTGRIMSFHQVGKSNVLWVNPALSGRDVPLSDPGWANFGGDKLWPAPQSDWNWPPDPMLERGAIQVRQAPDGLIIHGHPSSGLILERQIHLDDHDSTVRILDRLTNVSAKPVEKGIWEICQIDDPDSAALPIRPTKGAPTGWLTLQGPSPSGFISQTPDGTLDIRRDPAVGHKYGAGSPLGWVSARKGAIVFTISSEYQTGERYPDGGCAQEVFTSGDPLPYVELELLGPIRRLNPGQATSIEVRWTVGSS